jgi:hypothetical protein
MRCLECPRTCTCTYMYYHDPSYTLSQSIVKCFYVNWRWFSKLNSDRESSAHAEFERIEGEGDLQRR